MTDDATLSDFASADTNGDDATEASRTDGNAAAEAGDRSNPPADSSTAAEDASSTADEPTPDSADSSPETADDTTPPDDADECDSDIGEAGDTGFSTYAWGAYTCSQCEGASSRVWRSDGELVCVDCKRW